MLCAQGPVASLTKPAILNNANVALVDAMHHSIVIDALTMTLIKDNDDLLGTVNSHIKPPLKRCKTKAADSRHAKASRGRTKKDKDSEDSNTSSDVLRPRRRDRAAACAQSAKRKQLEKEAQLKKTRDEEKLAKAKKEKEEKESLCKSRDGNRTLHSRRLTDAYILYFKELLSNNSRIFANAIGIGKTRAIVLAVLIRHFCFFSNSPPENIGRPTKEEAIEMQIDTTNAISKALAAANKLIIPEANTPAVHPKATKHFCGFRKVDKHVFRAYNTISVTAQRMIIRKGGPYIEKRAILLPSHITRNIIANVKHDASEHKSSYKYKELISQGAAVGKLISGIKGDFLPYFQSCLYILEKEGLNKLEASRRVIFNCFEMQAIASYPALATLKAAQFKTYGSCKVKRFTLNSVKDLFTNLSKDYFLVREARAITKSSPKFQNLSNLCSKSIAAEDAAKAANTPLPLKEVCAKILIELYKPIVQARDPDRPWIIVALIAFAEAITLTEATHVVIIEPQDSIVYFNPDSKLELKVLGKQDVKTTS
ncbi:hypothetical protein HBH75_101760 [Parastagonospora nodorum]|nr:hypothetical protein HBH75_101760 [Parastagonospora nodorum]